MIKLEPNTLVHSVSGHRWKFIEYYDGDKEKWMDVQTGLVWCDVEDDTMTHYKAIELFNTDDKRLPTKEEWEEAEKHEIRFVLPNFNNKWFWSSSVHPDYYNCAYIFVGRDGHINNGNRYFDFYHSVRCISSKSNKVSLALVNYNE